MLVHFLRFYFDSGARVVSCLCGFARKARKGDELTYFNGQVRSVTREMINTNYLATAAFMAGRGAGGGGGEVEGGRGAGATG